MKIKNLAAKVIGIGSIHILPGTDTVDVPDEIAYVPVFDRNGERTGEKEILPSLRALERMNQIVIIETKAPEAKAEDPTEEEKKPSKSKKSK